MYDFISDLKQFCTEFNAKLPQLFNYPSGMEKRVSEAMFYSLSNGGKRLRPFLVCRTADIFNIPFSKSFTVAASLEMLHTYSLIHDDLPAMDNDDFRRGHPTCHKQYDEATAILAGDGLLTYAFETLSKADDISDSIKIKLCALLAQRAGAFNGMIAGQMLDLTTDLSPELSSSDTVKHIEEMKTGCLIAYACQSGAILGNASPEEYDIISHYARNIGIAFQITDDILDVTGDSSKMGKTLGKDLKQDKMTFVSLFGLKEAETKAAELINTAKSEISSLGEKSLPLQALADFIISRDH